MRPLRLFLVEDQAPIRRALAETLEALAPASVAAWAEGQAEAWLARHADPATRARCLALGADAVFDRSREVDPLAHWCARQAVAAPWREGRPRPRHWASFSLASTRVR